MNPKKFKQDAYNRFEKKMEQDGNESTLGRIITATQPIESLKLKDLSARAFFKEDGLGNGHTRRERKREHAAELVDVGIDIGTVDPNRIMFRESKTFEVNYDSQLLLISFCISINNHNNHIINFYIEFQASIH